MSIYYGVVANSAAEVELMKSYGGLFVIITMRRSRKDGSRGKNGRPSTLSKVLAGNNGRGANTGSRLCNHSITALSPQRSAKRGGKPSVNIISYSGNVSSQSLLLSLCVFSLIAD